jgi:hypothetical protein
LRAAGNRIAQNLPSRISDSTCPVLPNVCRHACPRREQELCQTLISRAITCRDSVQLIAPRRGAATASAATLRNAHAPGSVSVRWCHIITIVIEGCGKAAGHLLPRKQRHAERSHSVWQVDLIRKDEVAGPSSARRYLAARRLKNGSHWHRPGKQGQSSLYPLGRWRDRRRMALADRQARHLAGGSTSRSGDPGDLH